MRPAISFGGERGIWGVKPGLPLDFYGCWEMGCGKVTPCFLDSKMFLVWRLESLEWKFQMGIFSDGFQKAMEKIFGLFKRVSSGYLGCGPPPSKSDHQDYYIFSRESQPKPSFPLLLGGGTTQWISLNSKRFQTFLPLVEMGPPTLLPVDPGIFFVDVYHLDLPSHQEQQWQMKV